MALQIPEAQLIEFAKTVRLKASLVLEGVHRSLRGGQGIEFQSSLPYSEGEDARFIDWKRFAATDRYFVNRFEKSERNSWTISVDATRSMNYGTKAGLAQLWAGALIFMAEVWGDRWNLVGSDAETIEEAFSWLFKLFADESSDRSADLIQILESQGSRSDRLILISDFFSDEWWEPSLWSSTLSAFRSAHLIQILDPREIEFPFREVTLFHDLESPKHLTLDAGSVRSVYQKQLGRLQMKLKDLVGSVPQASYQVVRASPDDHFEHDLSRLMEEILQ